MSIQQLSAVLISVVFVIVSIVAQQKLQRSDLPNLDFPVEILSDKRVDSIKSQHLVMLILQKQYYSQSNLEQLFRWYLKKYPDIEIPLLIEVFTSRESFASSQDKQLGLPIRNQQSPAQPSPRRLLSCDAILHRERRGIIPGKGVHAWYIYNPLDGSLDKKTVVIHGKDPHALKNMAESWETSNLNIRLRLISYSLAGVEPPDAYYTLYTSPSPSGDWKEVLTLRQAVKADIPRHQVRFVNDQIAYVFMGGLYVATTDSGRNWFQWDAESDLPNQICCNAKLIRDVVIKPDGNGEMALTANNESSHIPIKLFTTDYGRHWGTN